jgi:signal transduction histidine kinase
MKMDQRNGYVCLSVQDNGKGLPDEASIRKGAFGLTGMRARAHSSNGTLTINTAPDKGTSIEDAAHS